MATINRFFSFFLFLFFYFCRTIYLLRRVDKFVTTRKFNKLRMYSVDPWVPRLGSGGNNIQILYINVRHNNVIPHDKIVVSFVMYIPYDKLESRVPVRL
jgi:hypothetical protein